jgi:hypothetical protein
MMRDDKLVRASLRAKQSIERVVWVWGAVLESAAEIDDDGRYEVDPAEIAYFLRCKVAPIQAVLNALVELGRVDGERVTAWSKRQFKSDRSNERVAVHRANKKHPGNVTGNVTSPIPERDGNSPETKTETETEVPLANANGATVDADTTFWTSAKAYLATAGVRNPGAVVGAWIRDHGKTETASALTRAQLERAVEPIPFVQGCFRSSRAENAPAIGI